MMHDDEGRLLTGTDHHYTPENIQSLIAQLRRFASGSNESAEEFASLDWRGWSNVLWRVMSALAADAPLADRASRASRVGAQGGAVPSAGSPMTEEQKDAARYRWLRERAMLCDTCGENGWTVEVCLDYATVPVEVGASVDEAIDAAMSGIGAASTSGDAA